MHFIKLEDRVFMYGHAHVQTERKFKSPVQEGLRISAWFFWLLLRQGLM